MTEGESSLGSRSRIKKEHWKTELTIDGLHSYLESHEFSLDCWRDKGRKTAKDRPCKAEEMDGIMIDVRV